MGQTTTLCVINQKGGSGKTSACFHLAGALAEIHRRTLLIDVDPQGSLSQGFLGPALVESLPAELTVATILGDLSSPEEATHAIRPTDFDHVHILPASHHLAPVNVPSPERSGMAQFLLRDFVELQLAFDVVLIDCPPNLYHCTWAALMAADMVLIPVPPEDFGAQGLRAVHQAARHARRLNPRLREVMHVVTRFDRRLLVHRCYEQSLRNTYGATVLQTVLSEVAAFKVAVSCRQPVVLNNPRSNAARLTRQLTHEILDRIDVQTLNRSVA